MRAIITGVKNGKSCVVQEIDLSSQGEGMSFINLADMAVASPPPRPAGNGAFADLGVPVGTGRWMRVGFPANEVHPNHNTDTIDCHTIVAGSIELLLDDGAHRLLPGDSAMVTGVDHGWRVGPEGCTTSLIVIGTPAP